MSSGSTLTTEYLKALFKAFDKIPKIPIGIVCRPNVHEWCLRNLAPCPDREAFGLGGIPVYVKFGLEEDYRLFYDHAELRAFLAES